MKTIRSLVGIILFPIFIDAMQLQTDQPILQTNIIDFVQNLPREINQLLSNYLTHDIDLWEKFTVHKELKISNSRVTALSISQDQHYLVAGTDEDMVLIWDLRSSFDTISKENALFNFQAHEGPISYLNIHGDSSHIATTSDKSIKFWQICGQSILQNHELVCESNIRCATLNDDWSYALIGCTTGKVLLCDLRYNSQRIFPIDLQSIKTAKAVSFINKTSALIAIWGQKNVPYKIYKWDFNEGIIQELVSGLPEEGSGIIKFGSNCAYALHAPYDKPISLINLEQNNRTELGSNGTSCICISKDNEKIIIGGVNKLELYNKKGILLKSFSEQKEQVSSITMSQDNSYIVAGSIDGIVRIWTYKPFLEVAKAEMIVALFYLENPNKTVLEPFSQLWDSISPSIKAKFFEEKIERA